MITQQQVETASGGKQSSNVHDLHTREHIAMLLRTSGYWALSRLECEVTNGIVVLSGTVSCYFLKQVAQSLVVRSPDVKVIENQIEVRP